MNQRAIDVFFRIIYKDENVRNLFKNKLRNVWRRLDNDDRNSFSQKHGGTLNDDDNDDLLNEFHSYLGKHHTEIENNKKFQKFQSNRNSCENIAELVEDLCDELVNDFFNKCVKEEVRNTPGTFAHLYRSVQRFAKETFPDRLYPTARTPQVHSAQSQYFGPAGLSEVDFCLARGQAAGHNAPELNAIPLPHDAPTIASFYSGGDRCTFRSAAFVQLLAYFRDAAEERGLGRVVQLRSFVYWLNGHYSLLENSAPSRDDVWREQVPDFAATPTSAEDEAMYDNLAKALCRRMTADERRMYCAIVECDSLDTLAARLHLDTPQQAHSAKQHFIRHVLRPNVDAIPELFAQSTSHDAWVERDPPNRFLDVLYEFCKNACGCP